jgi:hypothetical protein
LHKGILTALVGVGAVFGFLLGFNISTNTGVEPGFFEIAEAGGYGAGAGGAKAPEGLSEDLAEYYSDLAK